MRARIIAVILLLAVGAGWWWWAQNANASTQGLRITGSGTVEADTIAITSEVSGQIRSLAVDEGQDVEIGQTLAVLDTALLDAQLGQAQAAVSVAKANLALARAGARPEDIATAQAQVDHAQAQRDGAAKAYEHALTILKDPQDLDAQVVQAQSQRDTAQRNLAQLRASARPEDLSAAQASLSQSQASAQAARDRLSAAKTDAEAQVQQAALALTQAQASYAQAKSNWDYVQETGKDPIDPRVTDSSGKEKDNKVSDGQRAGYYAAYAQAEARLRSAEAAVQQAQVAAEAARQAEVTGVQQADTQVQQADAALAKLRNGATKEALALAETALANAQKALDVARQMRANPLQLQAAADAAKAQLEAADATLAQAKAQLEQAKSGSRPEQIQAAEAAVQQAQAAQRQIEVQIAKATVVAPSGGVVLSRVLHAGELASAGATLLTIGTLDTVHLTLYIAETEIGQVRQGQRAQVTVDSFPGRVFDGTVTYIAQEAQFTPRNVQTKDQRTTTVFAVKVTIPNQDHALKPGMPADGVIIE
ncbi:HlyD family efflux transporter periplasmic adaptor subunit [Chloroflexia bacterium SDU3-3]|nr:HlyD family efflux transporter periplasmic adaptor subunit [Chloroflexia bacterium SDU3-3]